MENEPSYKKMTMGETLATPPDKNHIVKHPFVKIKKDGKNVPYEYLPISHIQTLLDEFFGWDGWQLSGYETKIVANELVGQITLSVFSERTQSWVSRVGTAATMVRQETNAVLSDYNAKLKNALEADAPHLLSDCIKSAAKQFGRVFGRDLGRDKTDIYDPSALENLQDERNPYKYIDALYNCTTNAEFVRLRNECLENKLGSENSMVWAAFVRTQERLKKTLCIDSPKLNEIVLEVASGKASLEVLEKHYIAITPEARQQILNAISVEPPKTAKNG